MPIRIYHEPGWGVGAALGLTDAARAMGEAKIAAAQAKYEAARTKAASMETLGQNLGRGIEQASQAYADAKRRMADWQRQRERDERMAQRWLERDERIAKRQEDAAQRDFERSFFEEYGYDPWEAMKVTRATSLGEATRILKKQVGKAKRADKLTSLEDELGLREKLRVGQEQRAGKEWDRRGRVKAENQQKLEQLRGKRAAEARGEGFEPARTGPERDKYNELYTEATAIASDPNIPEEQKSTLLDEIEAELRQLEPGSGLKKIVVPFEQRLSTHETEDFLWTEQADGKITVTKKTADRDKGPEQMLKDARDYAKTMTLGALDKGRNPRSTEEYMLDYVKSDRLARQMMAKDERDQAWLKKANAKLAGQLDEQQIDALADQIIERFGADTDDPEALALRDKLLKRLDLVRQQKAAQQSARMPMTQPAMAPAAGGSHGWLEGGG